MSRDGSGDLVRIPSFGGRPEAQGRVAKVRPVRYHCPVDNLGNQMSAIRIFVGWDSGEPEAYEVCRHSLERHASEPLEIIPVIQPDLRAQGLYSRDTDPLAATEFTYTRFLVPHLAGFTGWALFCDCDFLWTRDVSELFAARDDRYAVMCVQHDYRPTERLKMNGQQQTVYPRKNWSSLMLLNCGHAATRRLIPAAVNDQTGAYLHRFEWADDREIGNLDPTWNWLEGWNTPFNGAPPGAIHYTRGGPWFENWRDVDYADLWLAEARDGHAGRSGRQIRPHRLVDPLHGRLPTLAPAPPHQGKAGIPRTPGAFGEPIPQRCRR